ncbi:MAG: TonB-dependent receptor [Terriglobales bacterium]
MPPSDFGLARIGAIALVLLLPGLAQRPPAAAPSRLQGQVLSSDGLAIPGATVSAAAGVTAQTDRQGRFQLRVASLPAQLEITAAGFAPQRILVRKVGPLRVVLAPASVTARVTVAATGRRQAVTAVPVLAETLDASALESAPQLNLDSQLRQFPALSSYRRSDSLNAHPTTQGISLLGTGSSGASRALVLRDGIPLNDFYGDWVDWLRVPDDSVAQLTVVEGGASPLYGSGALAGVVNIVSRQPNQTHASVQTGMGNLSTGVLQSYSSIAGGSLSAGLGQQSLTTTGYIPVPPAEAGAVDTPAGVAANEFAPEIRYIPNSRLVLSLDGEYFGESRGNGTRLEKNSTALRQLALHFNLQAGGFWQGSLFQQSETFASSFVSVAADRDSETLVLDQRVPSQTSGAALDWAASRVTPWGPVHAILGASYLDIQAVDDEFAPLNHTLPYTDHAGRQRLAGAFAESQWRPWRNLELTATLRDDHWRNYAAFTDNFGLNALAHPAQFAFYPNRSSSAVSPSLGAVWHPPGPLSFRLSAYESFRAPSLNELYRPFRVGDIETLANPALTAERYRGYQGGADLRLGRHGLLRATYFDGMVSNVITAVTLSSTPSLITEQRQNLGRLRSRGEEWDGRWSLRPGLWLWAAYAHLHSIVASAPSANLIGRHIAEVPDNNATFRAVDRWQGWTLSAEERFGGAEFEDDLNTVPLPAFWTTGVYASRVLPYHAGWLRSIAPYLAVQNLFNRRYAVTIDPVANLASPLLLTAGLRLRFGQD